MASEPKFDLKALTVEQTELGIIGPRPKDEEDRLRLKAQVIDAMEAGHTFNISYLLEEIFTDVEPTDSKTESLVATLGKGYVVIDRRLHGPTVATAEEAKALYKKAMELESLGVWVSPSWVEHLWEVMDVDE